ncbi:phosphotransferase family protein [Variovorax saccharolyticus]|uniref:phosphotransferase family protein n=1 Tax=Variovorax saccharolyticus TaxID=3053516 RepID=UPI002578F9EB|nr:phosphotransferase family protein [Variovorax sp. J22R187]MDM0018236.1 phosphotransferase family protein [Variovorax sp. J22R187]
MTASVVSAPPLDLDRLGAWLQAEVRGFRGLREAQRLIGGNSNPIWQLRADSGCYILRTQPAGQLLKSAHALDREFRLVTTLHGTAVPVPKIHVLCNDLDIVGVQFYLMDFIEGRVHRHVGLPELPAGRRRAVYASAIDSLAAIHRTDIDALGLADFGRPGNYFERQFHRWCQQYRTAMPEGDPEMERLIAALEHTMPHGAHRVVLLHGDSRLDNLMFAADEEAAPRVIAVLDWELSTLGHPLADLGQFLAVQSLPADYLLPGLAGVDRAAQGLPSEAELRERYFRAMGESPVADLRFFKAFAMFRQAAMSAGLRRRAALGTAVAESALHFGNTMAVFARVGLDILDRPD